MSIPAHKQAVYWGAAAAAFFSVIWLLGDVLLPFLIGGAIAYFLDPLADRLERLGLSRVLATLLIALGVILCVLLLIGLVIPALVSQTAQLVEALPALFTNLQVFITDRFPRLIIGSAPLTDILENIAGPLQQQSGELVTVVMGSALGVINMLVLVLIVPVVAIYLLMDWDKMTARIDALLPREHAPVIRTLAREIDETLSSFLRGQGTVCLLLGGFYAVALMVAGLEYGLVVGVIAGLISFIPYVGAFVGGALAIGLALFQFWGEWWMVAVIASIFAVGQMVEGNLLTPLLVGDSVGLHPVWLLLALSVFGAMFGFPGMLIAVPLAAIIGVLARFAVGRYEKSELYLGRMPRV